MIIVTKEATTATLTCSPGWTPDEWAIAIEGLMAEVTEFDYSIAEDGTETFILREVTGE